MPLSLIKVRGINISSERFRSWVAGRPDLDRKRLRVFCRVLLVVDPVGSVDDELQVSFPLLVFLRALCAARTAARTPISTG